MDDKSREILYQLYEENYIPTPKALESLKDSEDVSKVSEKLSAYDDAVVITEEIVSSIKNYNKLPDIDLTMFYELKSRYERGEASEDYLRFKNMFNSLEIDKTESQIKKNIEIIKTSTLKTIRKDIETSFEILMFYKENREKRGDIEDFESFFRSRYRKLAALISSRKNVDRPISISIIKQKMSRDEVYFIGMIREISKTKKGNLMLTVEDLTASINVLINMSNPDIAPLANLLTHDEVIGIKGIFSGRERNRDNSSIVFCSEIYFPDIPYIQNIPRSSEEVYGVFISDIHIGSNTFLEKDFTRFIKWVRGEIGKKSVRECASRVGYLFIAGDCVDGIGVYKDQEKELSVKDLDRQYKIFSEYIELIPEEISVFIIPGNHDATREAEPQPPLPKIFAENLYDIPNVTLLSNPSLISVNVHDNPIKVLMYHGASIDSIIDAIPSIDDGYNKPHNVMKEMLRKRHIAPIYGRKHRLFPEKEDYLVIETIPHIFHTGHVHTVGIGSYKNVSLINSGTFQGRTEFQIKLGHRPTPSIIPIMNLQTGEIRKIRFGNPDR